MNWFAPRNNAFKLWRSPRDSGMLPIIKGTNISVKSRWTVWTDRSHGTDHPEKWGKLTCKFVFAKVQIGQFQKIPQGSGDGSCVPNMRKMTSSQSASQVQMLVEVQVGKACCQWRSRDIFGEGKEVPELALCGWRGVGGEREGQGQK